MASAPLSPLSPLFLHVAASRTRACWIRLAPTHQLSTLPCPLELHPPFSGTTRSLDTPAVGSPMMCCLPYAHKLGCLRLGRSRQKISTPLTQLSLLPPPPISAWLWCQCPVGVVGRRVSIVSRVSGFQGPRVKGFQGLNGFKGTKGPRASGFQGIEGFPMLTGAFKGFGVSKIQGFQGKYIKYELD